MFDVDFVRDGKVGDKVSDPAFGKGIIVQINPDEDFPIKVQFENIMIRQAFTKDGRYFPVAKRTLCWGHHEFHIDQGQPPKHVAPAGESETT
ncbi:MAG: hypothetical protein D6732_03005 [Methanobacteriota archaeon]|nr:MAG: hypothetical protein D6732_03005 [Euryarchaeota archaeon]